MTQEQIVDFSKLELSFLEAVRRENVHEQLHYMEVIFYWLRKEQDKVIMLIASNLQKPLESIKLSVVTDQQKADFGYLQIEMIRCIGEWSGERMVGVEMKMRVWIDAQLSKAASRDFNPKMRITPNRGSNGKS